MSEKLIGMIVLAIQIALYVTWKASATIEKGKYSTWVYALGFLVIAVIAFANIAVAVWAIGMIMG